MELKANMFFFGGRAEDPNPTAEYYRIKLLKVLMVLMY